MPAKKKFITVPYGAYLQREDPWDEEELTRIGPGTPAGEYLRRFWQPVALSSELKDTPHRIRIMGEDLVAFRDGSDRVGVLQLHCAHRGTSLEFGIVSSAGIRCCYHGWLFDVDGKVLEMPSEPSTSSLKNRLYQGAYPAMERHGIVLSLHGEVTDPDVDVFDRERVFVERHLAKLVRDFPALKIVVEHLTTQDAADFVRAAPPNVAATITPQHLRYSRNALFAGGLRPHWYCLPVLKRETHRMALVAAATSGSPKFFLGTDSAPHSRGVKESACCGAGCYTAPLALELYAEVFDDAGALDRLEGFASVHGAAFYGLSRNAGTVTLKRARWQVPIDYPFDGDRLVPLRAGETLGWQLQ